MSTIAPPSKPLNPVLVDSEHYVDEQIRRTRRALKLVDLGAGLITLAIGLLAFVLLAAVLDHWVVPGGLNSVGRMLVFGLMLVAVALYGWRQFIPLLRPINPVYAAHTIERGAPSLKNSLLNLLLFRTHRQQMSARVYHALEQQAALRLSNTPIDASVDRTALLRLGYALLLIIAVCAVYSVLSPKNMALSAARVLAPWSDIPPPSRVQIMNIRPGDISVARGEPLEIEATVGGLREGDRVRVRYSTADDQLVDEAVRMKAPDAGIGRFVAELPPKSDTATGSGVQQNLVYWIEAGDAVSKKYRVTVFSRPTLVVQKVRYDFPAYTGFPSREAASKGDIRGLEGTRVTVSAIANQPIKSAYIDFNADGRSDLKMTADGDQATATFVLALREDRRTPQHPSYVLRLTTTEGRTNSDPPKYTIDVTPDYAPEIRVVSPEEPERTVRIDEMTPIEIEARDPDFALASVRLLGKVGDRELPLADLLAVRHEGRFGAIKPFTPGDAGLKAGDVLEYWAEARDSRRPEANVAMSEHRRLKIAGPVEQPPAGQQQRPRPGDPNAGGQQGDPQQGQNEQGGQAGQGGTPQAGDQQDGQSDGGEAGGQSSAGGPGGKGQKNDKNEGQQGAAGGGGEGGDSQPSEQQEQQAGEGGAGGANNADQSQQPGEQSTGGANNSAGNAGQPQAGQDQAQPGDNSGDPSAGEQQPGEQQSAQSGGGEGQPGNPGDGGQNAQPEKVSAKGDDDATAMERIRQHLAKQEGGSPQAGEQSADPANQQPQDQSAQGQPQAGETQAPGANQAKAANQAQGAKAQQGEGAESQPQRDPGAEQAERATGDQQGAGQPQQSKSAAKAGEKPQQNPSEGAAGEQPQSAPDGATPQAGQSGEQGAERKAGAEGTKSSDPQQQGGDAQRQTPGAGDQQQGADTPQDPKLGDGNPNDAKSSQQPSTESNTNNNNGDAGAGHNSDKQEGTASTAPRRGKEKQDEGDRNKELTDDQEPPSGADSKSESDSEGGQGGDQSGGGQEGQGQKSDSPGKGSSGQNEAADSGSGRADEQGAGETGEKSGDQQQAAGKTGRSSENQAGQGSKQGAAKPSPQGENPDGENPLGEQTGDDSKLGGDQEPGDAESGEQQDNQSGAQGSDQPPSGEGESGESTAPGEQQPGSKDSQGRQGNQPGKQAGDQRPSPQTAGQSSAQPQGGGQGASATGSSDQLSAKEEEDAANLDFARKQTDLVLERLDQQLAKKQVDKDLLKNLGWNETELKQFIDRWKGLKERATSDGDDREQAQRELDQALGALGLRPQGPTRVQASAKADKLRVNDSFRAREPMEYSERVRQYSKNIATGEKKD